MRHHQCLSLGLAVFAVVLPAFAQPASAQPASAQPASAPSSRDAIPSTNKIDPNLPTEGLMAVVESVTGNVKVRKSKDAPWEPAVVGMQLGEGAVIRTGLRSAIRCVIPPDQVFTLDRLGEIALTEAVKQGNYVKTDLTMKYGRAQYEIAKAGIEHDAAITSPGATLAVRGTTVELEDMPPFRTRAISYTGRAFFTAERRSAFVGSAGGSKATIDTRSRSAAEAALFASVVDPRNSVIRTPADSRLIAQQVSLGGTATFDKSNDITIIRGGSGPIATEASLLPTLPGELNFVARWTGDADVNLSVSVNYGSPATTINLADKTPNEYVYPGFGLDQSPSGGRTDFDHRGGSNGGTEIVYWKNALPQATYGVVVDRISGVPTNVTVNAFKRGEKLPIYSFFIDPNGPTTTPALTPGEFDFGDFQITFRDGKSTTFTYGVGSTPTDRFGVGIVYDPISSLPSADPESGQTSVKDLPDLNNGAPADITTAPQTARLLNSRRELRTPRVTKPSQATPNARPAFGAGVTRNTNTPEQPRK